VTGSDRESAEHFLFHCSKYAEAKCVMFGNIFKDILHPNSKGQCTILLIMPPPR